VLISGYDMVFFQKEKKDNYYVIWTVTSILSLKLLNIIRVKECKNL